ICTNFAALKFVAGTSALHSWRDALSIQLSANSPDLSSLLGLPRRANTCEGQGMPINVGENPPSHFGGLNAEDFRDLASAKAILENPGLTARLSNLLGSPIEKGFKMLPRGWSETINKVSRAALFKALQVAVVTMGRSAKPAKSSNRLHKLLVGASGGIGGAFGLAALAVELPISTTIMLRSIAEIARSEGHDPRSVQTRLACLEVLA